MEFITILLTKIISDAFVQCGYDAALGLTTVSDRPELCQYQCNGALSGAKIYKLPPVKIAQNVVDVLAKNAKFASVTAVAPGFINIVLTDEFIMENYSLLINDQNLGIKQIDKEKTIIVDYGGPNIAKPLHIGHLRAAIIGESVKRLARKTGYNVLGDVHMGDWGMPMGLVIAEMEERYPDWQCFYNGFIPEIDEIPDFSVDLLNEIYPFASKKSKENVEFRNKAGKITKELQNQHAGYFALWKKIREISIPDMKKSYDSLGVEFDIWYGESDADPYIAPLIELLTEKGLLYESDGAMIIDVKTDSDKAPMPPIMIVKSDKSVNYATTDVATIVQREKDYQPDKIWYCVDRRQDLHFSQVFRCVRMAEIAKDSTELEFLGFGTMNGSDGKPYKTRDGGVMQLSDFINMVIDGAMKKLDSSDFVSDTEQKIEIAKKLGIAAIKFGDLVNFRAKDYIFDLDKFISFEGKTGIYILYTVTRINSILKKAEFDEAVTPMITGIYSDVERDLILSILQSGEVYERAINEKAPHYIAENVYRLSVNFSRFYHENYILNEENQIKRSSWLALSVLTKKVILNHLYILGIEPVDHM